MATATAPWRVRSEDAVGEGRPVELRRLQQAIADGAWSEAAQVRGPRDDRWISIGDHPQTAEFLPQEPLLREAGRRRGNGHDADDRRHVPTHHFLHDHGHLRGAEDAAHARGRRRSAASSHAQPASAGQHHRQDHRRCGDHRRRSADDARRIVRCAGRGRQGP